MSVYRTIGPLVLNYSLKAQYYSLFSLYMYLQSLIAFRPDSYLVKSEVTLDTLLPDFCNTIIPFSILMAIFGIQISDMNSPFTKHIISRPCSRRNAVYQKHILDVASLFSPI